MNLSKAGKQLAPGFDMNGNISGIRSRGKEMLKVFEEAAKEIAKESKSESVRIDVGTVQNSKFAQEMQAAGYIMKTEISVGWIK